MNNSLKNKRETTGRGGLTPPAKGKTKTFLIGKELKTNTLLHTAAERASGPTTKPNPKPESKPRIASAEGRVKPLARLLRCATALRVTAPLGYGSRRLVWPKGTFRPVHTARPPFPCLQGFLDRSSPSRGRFAALRAHPGPIGGMAVQEGKGGTAARWEPLSQTSDFATAGDSNVGKNAASLSQEIKCSANSGASTGQKHSGR